MIDNYIKYIKPEFITVEKIKVKDDLNMDAYIFKIYKTNHE